MCLLVCPSHSPDLNPKEMLWNDFKRADHTRLPTNGSELKWFCKEECSKIPPERCPRSRATECTCLKSLLPNTFDHGFTYVSPQNCECLMDVFNKDVRN